MSDPTHNKVNLTKQTLSGFSWSYISIVLQALLQLGTVSVLARILSPAEFGVYGIALIFINFIERVGFAGLGPALVQKHSVRVEEERNSFTISALMGILATLGLYFFSDSIAVLFGEPLVSPVLKVLSFICLIESCSQILEHLLQRNLRFKSMLMFNNLAFACGNGALAIGLAYYGFGVWSLAYGTLCTRVLKLIFFYKLHPVVPEFISPFSGMKELLSKGLGFAMGRLFSFLALQGDNLVIGKMLGPAALGMYGRAYQLMTLPANYFGQVLEKVLFPALSRKQEDKETVSKIFLWTVQLSSLVGVPTSIFMYICAEDIILFLFGPKWVEVIPTLQILALGVFFRLAYKNADTLARSQGLVYRHAARQLIYTLCVIIGAYIGASYGLTGVATAVVLAVVVNYFLLCELCIKTLKISWLSFLHAHSPFLWFGVILFSTLKLFSIYLSTLGLIPFISLLLQGGFLTVLFILALKFCPNALRPDVANLIHDRIPYKKIGKAGKIIHWILNPNTSH